jgi:hypothetical protein
MVQAEPEAKDGIQGYKVVYSEPDKPDYVSWCPKDIFERHNRETSAMPFSHALEAVKQGKKIARKGWNGKGMFLFLADSAGFDTRADVPRGLPSTPSIVMKTADDRFLVGWLASQTDMLSDDWFIVEESSEEREHS